MNKIYDKLLLVVAVLILAAGAALYMKTSGSAPSLEAPVDTSTAENPYQPEAVPTSATTEASWPEVLPQSTGWRYDVFTPPKIFIDAEGRFTEQGWEPPAPPPPFGVYLAEIVRKPYRLQFEGYIEEDRSDPSKTLLLLFDEEAQQQVRARPGDERPSAAFKVIDFDIQRIRDADNNIEVVAKATLLDQRSGEEVVLTHGERLFESGVTVVIRSQEDATYQKELTEAPAEFEGPLGTYTLLQINLEESSITVEKHAVEDEEESVTRTLRPRGSSATSSTSAGSSNSPQPSPSSEASGENPFDLMF
jgi:hypothetical protein